MKVSVDLSYKFQKVLVRQESFWNVCKVDKCSAEIMRHDTEGNCYFPIYQNFTYNEGVFLSSLYLPATSLWSFCLSTPLPILGVSGMVSAVPMSLEDRRQRAFLRTGFSAAEAVTEYDALSIINQLSQQDAVTGQNNGLSMGSLLDMASLLKGDTMTANKTVLNFWDYSEIVTPCARDCMAAAGCFFKCPLTRVDGERISDDTLPFTTGPPLNNGSEPEFSGDITGGGADDPSLVYRRCMQYLSCNQFPEARLLQLGLNATCPGSRLWMLDRFNLTKPDGRPAIYRHPCPDELRSPAELVLDRLPRCAPDCPTLYVGNKVCDLECALHESCGLDFADCCEEHIHAVGTHHFHCPTKSVNKLLTAEAAAFTVVFAVPPLPPEVAAMTGHQGNYSDNVNHGSMNATATTPDRLVGTTNRLIAGCLLHQVRSGPANRDSRFSNLKPSRAADKSTISIDPFGSNAFFLRSSDLYIPEAVNYTQDFFTPDQLTANDVPHAFYPLVGVDGYDNGFPFFFDISATHEEVLLRHQYLEDSGFIDAYTRRLSFQVVAYNADLHVFGTLILTMDMEGGGAISTTSQMEIFSVELYDSPWTRFRGFCEVVFVILVTIGAISEGLQIRDTYRNFGSIKPHVLQLFNWIDATSIFIFYTTIIMWIIFVIRYERRFSIDLNYDIYEYDMYTPGLEARVKLTTALHNDGEEMRKMMLKFREVMDIVHFMDRYVFLHGINVVLMLIRVLKLTEFHPRLGVVTRTISRAANDIAHFLIIAAVVFTTFSYLALLLFGYRIEQYSSLRAALWTSFLMLTGEVGVAEQLNDLEGWKLVSAWIFLWLFIIVIHLLLLNFFLSFIIDALSEHMNMIARNSSSVFVELWGIVNDEIRYFWQKAKGNPIPGGDRAMADKLRCLIGPLGSNLPQSPFWVENAEESVGKCSKDNLSLTGSMLHWSRLLKEPKALEKGPRVLGADDGTVYREEEILAGVARAVSKHLEEELSKGKRRGNGAGTPFSLATLSMLLSRATLRRKGSLKARARALHAGRRDKGKQGVETTDCAIESGQPTPVCVPLGEMDLPPTRYSTRGLDFSPLDGTAGASSGTDVVAPEGTKRDGGGHAQGQGGGSSTLEIDGAGAPRPRDDQPTQWDDIALQGDDQFGASNSRAYDVYNSGPLSPSHVSFLPSGSVQGLRSIRVAMPAHRAGHLSDALASPALGAADSRDDGGGERRRARFLPETDMPLSYKGLDAHTIAQGIAAHALWRFGYDADAKARERQAEAHVEALLSPRRPQLDPLALSPSYRRTTHGMDVGRGMFGVSLGLNGGLTGGQSARSMRYSGRNMADAPTYHFPEDGHGGYGATNSSYGAGYREPWGLPYPQPGWQGGQMPVYWTQRPSPHPAQQEAQRDAGGRGWGGDDNTVTPREIDPRNRSWAGDPAPTALRSYGAAPLRDPANSTRDVTNTMGSASRSMRDSTQRELPGPSPGTADADNGVPPPGLRTAASPPGDTASGGGAAATAAMATAVLAQLPQIAQCVAQMQEQLRAVGAQQEQMQEQLRAVGAQQEQMQEQLRAVGAQQEQLQRQMEQVMGRLAQTETLARPPG
eukprot:jgi/Mesvir1/9758/Mv12215-RA.4